MAECTAKEQNWGVLETSVRRLKKYRLLLAFALLFLMADTGRLVLCGGGGGQFARSAAETPEEPATAMPVLERSDGRIAKERAGQTADVTREPAPPVAEPSAVDRSQADTSQADTSQADTSQADTSQADTSQADNSQADNSQADNSAVSTTPEIDVDLAVPTVDAGSDVKPETDSHVARRQRPVVVPLLAGVKDNAAKLAAENYRLFANRARATAERLQSLRTDLDPPDDRATDDSRQEAAAPVQEATPGIEPPPASPEEALVLLNPQETGTEIKFLADGAVVALRPGQAHRFPPGPARHIHFHRGGDFGYAEYWPAVGVYAFSIAPDGWMLSKRDDAEPKGIDR